MGDWFRAMDVLPLEGLACRCAGGKKLLWSEKRLSGEMLGEKAVTLSLSPTAAEMKPGVDVAIWAVADVLPHSYYHIAEVNSRGEKVERPLPFATDIVRRVPFGELPFPRSG